MPVLAGRRRAARRGCGAAVTAAELVRRPCGGVARASGLFAATSENGERSGAASGIPRVVDLDPESCYRALVARDPRFDGVFFIGVETTGIYCRPVCPARTPRRERCRYFASAALAERAGFRACFRCRPELSPGTRGQTGEGKLARALELLDEARGVAAVAEELGISSRHLRRLCEERLGVSPVELVQSRRLALAKRLLHDTTLPISEVALVSGFGSLRRFHAAFAARFGGPPSIVRGASGARPGAPLRLRLDYRPPFAWDATLRRLANATIPGLDVVSPGRYVRAVRLDDRAGMVAVSAEPGHLLAEVSVSLAPKVAQVVARVRRLFDLDARPDLIDADLSADPQLRPLVEATPGLRVGGAWEPLEAMLRALLGPDAAARLVEAHGEATSIEGAPRRLFPSRRALESLTEVDWRALDAEVPFDALASLLRGGPDALADAQARALALRALGEPDVFPNGRPPLSEHARRSESWRPWRSYAAEHLLAAARDR